MAGRLSNDPGDSRMCLEFHLGGTPLVNTEKCVVVGS